MCLTTIFLPFVCCGLVQIRADYIVLINKIKSGVLTGNSFSQVDPDQIIIDDCDLREMAPATFENMTIHRLNITRNPLKEVKRGVFINLFVDEMFLMDNEIAEIQPGCFHQIWGLQEDRVETLSLASNNLKTVTAGVFNVTNFGQLFLNSNKISYIEPDAFSDMLQLRRIDLMENYLRRIDIGVFQKLASSSVSIWLDFGKNKIDFIEPEAFENTSVLTLGLQDNNLGFITKEYFKDTNINILDI